MTNAPEPVGTVEVALAHAGKLLQKDPALAAEQAAEILKVVPGHPLATLFIGISRRLLGDPAGALEILQPLARNQPGWAPAHYELGVTLGLLRRGEDAVQSLRHAVRLKADIGDAWRLLGDHLTAMGDRDGADAAYAHHIRVSTRDPRLLAPAAALCDNRIPDAERLLRQHLMQFPTDVAAIRMLAEVAARLGRFADAESLLARCLELAPGFSAARYHYALVLHRQNRIAEALPEIDRLVSEDPRHPGYRNLKAAVLNRIGEYDRSLAIYEEVLAEYPQQAKVWMSYGHSLKTAGRQTQSVNAYRRSVQLSPQLGEAYWSLANLKTFHFTADEIDAMRTQLARTDLPAEDRYHFDFAMGKALEDAGDFAASFAHYDAGNRLRRNGIHYDAERTSASVERSRTLFTRAFMDARAGAGADARDPTFIVGLPRAGSTLVEQILASHSMVEGTMELPDITAIVHGLTKSRERGTAARYPEVVAALSHAELRALGERYLAQTRIQRKTAAPHFIDKLPNNWAYVGLIALILPRAKIIDARRHPMSCCFSAFKQHFARGQHFSYSLEDLGRYYRDYVSLMAHFDAVLPGRIHRVVYERMVEDTESEVRRLLAYCGLPYEEACLRFYENKRAVRTASSEQVRRPIFRDAVEQWRNFDPWLEPLRSALGPVLESYPEAPI